MALELSVPTERTAPPKDLEVRPRQAKAWLDALPLAQCVEAARQVRANLVAMSHAKLEFDTRVQLLDTYRTVSHVLLEELDAIYSRSSLPLTPKAREALGLARDIAAETANGCKIGILEKTGQLIAFGTKKQVIPLTYRAMQAIAAGIRAAYKSYTPIAPNAWKEFHALYLHAEKQGFAGEVVDAETKTTIADLYLEQLLLSLTDPYRLIQGEVEKTLAVVRSYRGLPTLGTARPATSPGGHFLVPCDLDKPPKPATSANDDAGGPNGRLLDANPLVDKLRQRLQAVEKGNVSATMSKMMGADGIALHAKLIALWGDPPKRAMRRDPMDSKVLLVAGIPSIGLLVSQEVRLDVRGDAEAIASAKTMPLMQMPGDEISRGKMSEWDVVNQSAGGIKVKSASAAGQSLTVGEAVGIWFAGRGRWTIGVMRWLTVQEDGSMEFGVQFLAPAARSVAVQPTTTTSTTVRAGLMLLESESAEESDTLLTPTSTYAELREFEVEEDGMISRVRARSLIEKTGRFELFHVSPS